MSLEPPHKKIKTYVNENFSKSTTSLSSLHLQNGIDGEETFESEQLIILNFGEYLNWSPEYFCSLLVASKAYGGFEMNFKQAQSTYHYMKEHFFPFQITSDSPQYIINASKCFDSLKGRSGTVQVKRISFLYRIIMKQTIISEDCSIFEKEDQVGNYISNNMKEMFKVVNTYVSSIVKPVPRKGIKYIKIIGQARTGKTTMARDTLPFFIQQEFLKYNEFRNMNFKTYYFNFAHTTLTSLLHKDDKHYTIDERFRIMFAKPNTHIIAVFDEVQLLSDEEIKFLKTIVTSNKKHLASIITGSSQSILLKAGSNRISFKECSIDFNLLNACSDEARRDTKQALVHFWSNEQISKVLNIDHYEIIKRTFGFVHPTYLTQIMSFMETLSFEEAILDLKEFVYEIYSRDYFNYITGINGPSLIAATKHLFEEEKLCTFEDYSYFFVEDETVKGKWKFKDTIFCDFLNEHWTVVDGIVKRKG